jgi:hypothetical protein
LERATERRCSLPHAGDADAGLASVAITGGASVVFDRQPESIGPIGDLDTGLRSRRVAARVCERFLHDPEGGKLDRSGIAGGCSPSISKLT